jgi:hypothetical protein
MRLFFSRDGKEAKPRFAHGVAKASQATES